MFFCSFLISKEYELGLKTSFLNGFEVQIPWNEPFNFSSENMYPPTSSPLSL